MSTDKIPLGGPAWLRFIADDREKLIDALGSFDAETEAEERREIQGWRDAANRMERLERVLSDLNFRVHSGYDFNADPDKMTLRVSEALS